jgi:predicted nucleotidyltransferase
MGKNAALESFDPGRNGRRVPVAGRTSMADALFSTTQQRVLALLFGQPERSFFTNELIGLAGAGSGAVQRELRRLAESGLATVTPVGNQKHYQANRAAPIFEELHALVVKILGPAEALREALAQLAESVRLALLYGSVAGGSDHAHSDIDLLIVSDELTLEAVYALLEPVEERLGRKVSPTLYTTAEFRDRLERSNPFLARVLTSEFILLTEDRDELLPP